MPTECSAELFEFAPVGNRIVVAGFDGGAITSDAGLCECFIDRRRPELQSPEPHEQSGSGTGFLRRDTPAMRSSCNCRRNCRPFLVRDSRREPGCEFAIGRGKYTTGTITSFG